VSSINSVDIETAPLDVLKWVELKDAIPLLVAVASSPLTVTVEPENAVSIPSPPAISTTVPSGIVPAPPLSAWRLQPEYVSTAAVDAAVICPCALTV